MSGCRGELSLSRLTCFSNASGWVGSVWAPREIQPRTEIANFAPPNLVSTAAVGISPSAAAWFLCEFRRCAEAKPTHGGQARQSNAVARLALFVRKRKRGECSSPSHSEHVYLYKSRGWRPPRVSIGPHVSTAFVAQPLLPRTPCHPFPHQRNVSRPPLKPDSVSSTRSSSS